MWMHGNPYYGTYGGTGFSLFPFVMFILFVLFIVFAVKAIFGYHHSDSTYEKEKMNDDDTAFQILRERYAKGEITKRQFLDMKKDLE
jgi:putative membrane protein